MTKTYRSIRYLFYQKVVIINGKNVICDFLGGVATPVKQPGTFSTDNIELQKALEKDKGYKVEYICISEDKPEIKVIEEDSEIKVTKEKILDIVNAQQAKDYLADRFKEVTYSQLKNKPMVLAVADKYGLEFPDWDI